MQRLIFQSDLCIGCKNCELACSLVNRDGSTHDTNRIKNYQLVDDILFASTFCQQCDPAPCLEVCDPQSLSRDLESSVIHLEAQKCNKCYLCLDACPFGGVSLAGPEVYPLKCELCGGDPMCVQYCPTQALRYGEEEKYLTKQQKLMAVRLVKAITRG